MYQRLGAAAARGCDNLRDSIAAQLASAVARGRRNQPIVCPAAERWGGARVRARTKPPLRLYESAHEERVAYRSACGERVASAGCGCRRVRRKWGGASAMAARARLATCERSLERSQDCVRRAQHCERNRNCNCECECDCNRKCGARERRAPRDLVRRRSTCARAASAAYRALSARARKVHRPIREANLSCAHRKY